MRGALAALLMVGCGATQHPAGGMCSLAGSWTVEITNATDPCGASEPGRAATLTFTSAAGGATSMKGWTISESGAPCTYVLHANKDQGATNWGELTLRVSKEGMITGDGHTDVAMSDGRVCSVPHRVSGTKR